MTRLSDPSYPAVARGMVLVRMMDLSDELKEGTQAFLEKRPPAFDRYR